jgi:hypothetical protein
MGENLPMLVTLEERNKSESDYVFRSRRIISIAFPVQYRVTK